MHSQSSDGDEGISPKSSGREAEDVDEWEAEVAEVALTSEFPLETTGRRGSLMAHIIMEFINLKRGINGGSAEIWSTEEGGRGRERGSGGSLGWQCRRDVSEDMATIYLATKRPVNMAIRHAAWTETKGRASRDAGERRRGGAAARMSQRLERAKDEENATRTRECRARGEGWLNRREAVTPPA
jgi:hypothetical protein